MAIQDPVAAYAAASNMEAMLVQQFLESHGVEAHAAEDHSVVGHSIWGSMPGIHKPQVWINRDDAERVAPLLAEFERRKAERDIERAEVEGETILVDCEACEQSSVFAKSLEGSIQDCPHCGAFVDVGESDWPFEEPTPDKPDQ